MAGGFMSGFGPAFGKAFSTGVENAQKAYDDEVKTKMAFALEQKTAFEKAKAADAALVKQAEEIAKNVPGAPDEAWKVAYSQLKMDRDPEKIIEELRKGSWSAVKTPEKGPEVETPVAKTASETAVEASVDAQMEGAMGEPTKAPETAASVSEEPVEDKGFFGKIVEDISKPRSERLKEDTAKRIGVDQDTMDEWLTGYTSDVNTDLKGYTFTPDLSEDADKLPTTPKGVTTYLFTQSDEYKQMLANGDQQGINDRLMEIETMYGGKEGSSTVPFYGIELKGGLTKAKVAAFAANIEMGLQSDNPEERARAQDYKDNFLPIWEDKLGDSGEGKSSITVEDIAKMNPQQLKGLIAILESSPERTPEEEKQLQIAQEAYKGQSGQQVTEANLESTTIERVRVADGKGGWTTVPALQQRLPGGGVTYVNPNDPAQPITGANPITPEETAELSKIRGYQKKLEDEYVGRVVRVQDTLETVKSVEDALRGVDGELLTTTVGSLTTMGARVLNEVRAGTKLIRIDERGEEYEDTVISLDEAAKAAGYSNFAALEQAASQRGKVGAQIMLLGFRAGAIEGQSGAAMSNKDFERFMTLFKSSTGNPVDMANKLRDYFRKEVVQIDNMRRAYSINTNITGFEQQYGYKPYANELPPVEKYISPEAAPLLDYYRSGKSSPTPTPPRAENGLEDQAKSLRERLEAAK